MPRFQAPPILTPKILAFVASCGSAGASRPEIVLGCGTKSPNLNQCLRRQLLPKGLLFQAGPDKRIRFFVTEADAEAYDRSIPNVMADARAARKARQKVQQAEYLERVKMRLLDKVVEVIRAAGAQGLSRQEVGEAVGGGKDRSAAIAEARKRGLIYSGGPVWWRRYFGDAESAEAWESKGEEIRDAHVKATEKARAERNRESKRASDARRREAARKERAKDMSRRKNAFVVVAGRDVPVKVHAPRAADLKTAQIVIPDHIKVQRCQPWTHDIRFQVAPGKRIIGEFTAEWRQRRSA